jgi:hypothetical protein
MQSINTVKFYSAVRNKSMWFEGKWVQVEDTILSNANHAQKEKGQVFSLGDRPKR